MSTEVTLYSQIADPASAVKQIGQSIAQSKIFGCQNVPQGEILALECMTRGLSPLSLAEKYDIIQGKLSMKADAMLAGFEDAGGKYKVVEYSPSGCEIEFSRGESKLSIRISWEDAQKESWPFKPAKPNEEKQLKHNWATPIGRQDMLWARVVSRGVRRLAPGVVCGRYTPEEIVDIPVASTATVEPKAETQMHPPYEDADFEVVPPVNPETESTVSPAIEPKQIDDSGNQGPVDGPCSEADQDGIKSAMEQAAQMGIKDIVSKVKAVLANAGGLKLADLTRLEAQKLRSAIDKKNLEHWLNEPLRKPAKNESSQS